MRVCVCVSGGGVTQSTCWLQCHATAGALAVLLPRYCWGSGSPAAFVCASALAGGWL